MARKTEKVRDVMTAEPIVLDASASITRNANAAPVAASR